jgi:16S rRNA (cytosine1402-N4)-methyltransferase
MHIPVLQKEVVKYLDPKPNENFIDCTVGEAGHTLAILEQNKPKGRVLGIDRDNNQILKLKKIERLVLVNDNFSNLKEIVKKEKFNSISGILFDLGMASSHLEESGRGFSFLKREPLDMRYDLENPLTAEKILNYWSENDIERILKEFGEEKFSSQIAREIIRQRKVKPINSTVQLVEILKTVIPYKYQHERIHFATRTFQALRIAVNDELGHFKKALPQAVEVLNKEGRLAVISFHSLEDRIVKNFFKEKSLTGELKILTKKPIGPGEQEIKINPRSRSGKLRVATKQ